MVEVFELITGYNIWINNKQMDLKIRKTLMKYCDLFQSIRWDGGKVGVRAEDGSGLPVVS